MSTPPLNWALTPPQQLWAKRTKREESKNPISNIYSKATAQHWCKTDTQMDKMELKTYQSVHRHRQLKICHGKGQFASKMVPTKWTATYRSMRLDSCLFSYIKINLKWIKDLNLGSETRKLLEDDAVWAWFSYWSPKSTSNWRKSRQMEAQQSRKLEEVHRQLLDRTGALASQPMGQNPVIHGA